MAEHRTPLRTGNLGVTVNCLVRSLQHLFEPVYLDLVATEGTITFSRCSFATYHISFKFSCIIICITHQSSNAWKLHRVFIHVHSKLDISVPMAPIFVLLAFVNGLSRSLSVSFKLICCS